MCPLASGAAGGSRWAIDSHDVHVSLQQIDGWNEALALKAILVQVARLYVRRRHQRDARLNKAANRPPRIIASAMSATNSSSKHNTRAS